MITGQLIMRKTNKVIDGREVVIVLGVMAAEKGEVIDLKGEHQYTLVGGDGVDPDVMRLILLKDSAVDRTKDIQGARPSQILTAPIWRI